MTTARVAGLLFRLGIASELISATGFIFLALALYRLFESVDRGQASLMVVLVLVSVPISFLAVVSELGALTVLSGADFLSVLGGPQREALALVFVRTHGQTLLVNEIFWGLWLVPLGVLVMRSGFAPRVIGALLILAGAAYIVITSVSRSDRFGSRTRSGRLRGSARGSRRASRRDPRATPRGARSGRTPRR